MDDNLIPFEKEYEKEKPVGSYELGIVEVEIAHIVGTVGRYRDFDHGFIISSAASSKRLHKIRKALEKNIELPPLELYKIKDHYFILDGHHRVIAARRMGIRSMRARVIEYLPPRNSLENILAREKSDFELKTGITTISLTELSQYEKLINQIREHRHYLIEKNGEELSFKDAAADWHQNIYMPIVERIEEEGIVGDYPERTIADLYVYISDHKWMESQRKGYDIGFAAALEQFHQKLPGHSLKELIGDLFHTFAAAAPRRKVFEGRTGLKDINLSSDHSYSTLLRQIKEHKYFLSQKVGREVALAEAALHWRFEVFEPVKRILEEERFAGGFPRKTSADLYLLLTELKWLESEKRGYDIGFSGALEEMRKKRHDGAGFRETIQELLRRLKAHILNTIRDEEPPLIQSAEEER
jgi:hypothetical protein